MKFFKINNLHYINLYVNFQGNQLRTKRKAHHKKNIVLLYVGCCIEFERNENFHISGCLCCQMFILVNIK